MIYKNIFSIVFIIISLSVCAQSENNSKSHLEQQNYLFFSPAEGFNNTFQIAYEHMLFKQKSSIYIAAGIFVETDSRSFRLGSSEEVQFRFYLNDMTTSGNIEKKRKFGFYFTPFFNHRYYQYLNYYNISLNSFAGGLAMGYKVVFDKFAMEAFIGTGFKFSPDLISRHGGNSFEDYDYAGILPKIGINIGYNF